MSDFNPQVITENDSKTVTLFVNGAPYVYWLNVYAGLGLSANHADKIMSKLSEGTHYIKFSRQDIKPFLEGISNMAIPAVRSYYFLNDEGWNRALMEIETNSMINRVAALRIETTKDKMASIFTRYQRGEVVSKAADLALNETPRDTFGITDKNLAIADSFIRHACPHLKIDPGLVISSSLAKAEQEIRNAGGTETLDHLKQMIPRALTGDPAMLTATTIGKHFSLPAVRINNILKAQGYQYRQTTLSSSRARKVWFPTEKGKPFGEWKPVTFGHRNGSVHEETKWYWNPLIIDELHRILFPPELPSMTLTEVEA